MFGELIMPPYEFTGIGTPELRLNGVPFPRSMQEDSIESYASTWQDSVYVDLQHRASEIVRQTPDREQARARVVALYSASPWVSTVLGTDPALAAIKVRFSFYEGEHVVSLEAARETPGPTLEQRHRRLIDSFRWQVTHGVSVAVGSGYTFSFPAGQGHELLAIMEQVKNGEVVDTDIGSPTALTTLCRDIALAAGLDPGTVRLQARE